MAKHFDAEDRRTIIALAVELARWIAESIRRRRARRAEKKEAAEADEWGAD